MKNTVKPETMREKSPEILYVGRIMSQQPVVNDCIPPNTPDFCLHPEAMP